MWNRPFAFIKAPTIVLGATALLFVGAPARAQSATQTPTAAQTTATQSTTAQGNRPAPDQDNLRYQGSDATRRELSQFDQFLDSHREVDEQLRRDPSLLDNRQFVDSHPELQTFLQDHPGIREDVRQNTDAFMHAEERYDNREDARARDNDARGRDIGEFNRFLDGHREIAEQLRRDPSLVNRRDFVDGHPDLRTYLQNHPDAASEIRRDPSGFMHPDQNFDNRADARADSNDFDHDRDRDRDSAEFRQFLDNHREIAEQLRRDPSRINDDAFVRDHAELQGYLQSHPQVREEVAMNSSDFMREDSNYNRADNNRVDRDPTHEHMANFGAFMSGHADIARDVSNRPEVVKDQKYVDNHPEFKTYLNANPEVRSELMANPESFVKGSQQYTNGSGSTTGSGSGTPTTGTTGSGMTGGKSSGGSSSTGSPSGSSAGSPGASGYSPGQENKPKP